MLAVVPVLESELGLGLALVLLVVQGLELVGMVVALLPGIALAVVVLRRQKTLASILLALVLLVSSAFSSLLFLSFLFFALSAIVDNI